MEQQDSLYNHPVYYDVLFSTSWAPELRFLEACFDRFLNGRVRRIFEPACGTGRLLWRLGRAGYEVFGLDLNERMLDYCNRRLIRNGLPPTAIKADMTDFRLEDFRTANSHTVNSRTKNNAKPFPSFCVAFNFVSSFCHLTTQHQALNHLRCVADALRPGGLYVLGFHLVPEGPAECDHEHWTAVRGKLRLESDLRVVDRDLKTRLDTMEFRVTATTDSKTMRLFDRFAMRSYKAAQFESLLRKAACFNTVDTFSFGLDIDRPITVDSDTEDVVYVLRKT